MSSKPKTSPHKPVETLPDDKVKSLLNMFQNEGEVPVPPTEKSKRTMQMEDSRTEFEQKQSHAIYQAFNDNLYMILDAFETKLPHNSKTYKTIKSAIQAAAVRDASYPMSVWLDTVGDHEDILRTYSAENVEKFLKVVPTMPLLDCLEVQKNWHLFKPSDIKALWGHFGSLFTYSDSATVVPVDLMTEIETMTRNLQMQGKIDMSKPIQLHSAIEIMQTAMKGNAKIQEGIARLNQMFAPQLAAEPPTYAKRKERLGADD